MEGVRLLGPAAPGEPALVEAAGQRTAARQEGHSHEAACRLEADLKGCLGGLARHLFGQAVETRWVDCYFPFTHPSWELEVWHRGEWLEVLGCGLMEQRILERAGAGAKVGWAFGLGLERLAMVLYGVPDIRLFWTRDSGVLSQWAGAGPEDPVLYKPVSKFPQCSNDISFWLPSVAQGEQLFSPNDFYDLVREVGGDQVEQVRLVDQFTHKKKQLDSQTYRIVYRDMEKTMSQVEANAIHARIEELAAGNLGVTIR
jgi:phenylalanyl-tRNA synthetase alpha chain